MQRSVFAWLPIRDYGRHMRVTHGRAQMKPMEALAQLVPTFASALKQ
jgi:hypothetical protein